METTESKHFFCEKKKQKTFMSPLCLGKEAKVFCFFCSKKKSFLSCSKDHPT